MWQLLLVVEVLVLTGPSMLLLILGAFLLPPVLNPATLILIGSGDLAPAIAWTLMASWALLVLFGVGSYLRLVMWILDPGPGKAITPARRVGICVFLAICAAYMIALDSRLVLAVFAAPLLVTGQLLLMARGMERNAT